VAAHLIYCVEGVRSTLRAGIGSYRRDILPLSEALQHVPNAPQDALTISKRRICAD
jgi:hypothetical protein